MRTEPPVFSVCRNVSKLRVVGPRDGRDDPLGSKKKVRGISQQAGSEWSRR